MVAKFENYNLYDESEFAQLLNTSGKPIALRFLPNPDGSGKIIVIIDSSDGYTNPDSVLGLLRDTGSSTPKMLPTENEWVGYFTYLSKVFPGTFIAN